MSELFENVINDPEGKTGMDDIEIIRFIQEVLERILSR